MTQYTLLGYFGDEDKPSLLQDKTFLAFDFGELQFGVKETIKQLKNNGLYPSEIAFDLLFLAILVQAADSRLNRIIASQDAWSREIKISLPVSNVSIWYNAYDTLKCMLDYLSGDFWTFEFRDRPANFQQLSKKSKGETNPSKYNIVSLFSGGLDSLIGAINALESKSNPFFVSHAGESGVSNPQRILFDQLKANYKHLYNNEAMNRLRYPPPRFNNYSFPDMKTENSSRSRSFLFFTLGIFSGSGFNSDFDLVVPENGLIALNVPLDPTRVGALSTRTTHPYYMHRWNDLINILGIPCRKIHNPYWNKTKGDMVRECKNQDVLKTLLPQSLSCAHPSANRYNMQKEYQYHHCGTCVPCIIRMAAVKSAWPSKKDETTYGINLNDDDITLASNKAEGTQIRSYTYAIGYLNRNPGSSKILIHSSGPLREDVNIIDDLADVYERGMAEVAYLLKNIKVAPYFKQKPNHE